MPDLISENVVVIGGVVYFVLVAFVAVRIILDTQDSQKTASYLLIIIFLPILGMVSCFYLMAQETHLVWMRFLIWLVIGLCIYFTYGYQNSRLAKNTVAGSGS